MDQVISQPSAAAADISAVLHHAAFAILSHRAFLRITGPDATRWLNGMVTNNVAALQPGEGSYNFLLNAQGRIQGDCTIYRDPSATGDPQFLLATDAPQIDTIQQLLDNFIIMDDVELTPALTDQSTLLLLGIEAPSHLAALNFPPVDPLRLTHAETPQTPILLLTPPAALVPRYELRATAATVEALASAITRRGVPEASPETLEHLRILEARPRYGTDITEKYLPQETNQPQALHFAKGCYLGQEIVERIRSRGQVHRIFTPLRLEGSLPSLPTPLESNGKPVGELTSAAEIPLDTGPTLLALGYVRREALDTGAPLTYPGGSAFPRAPRKSA